MSTYINPRVDLTMQVLIFSYISVVNVRKKKAVRFSINQAINLTTLEFLLGQIENVTMFLFRED